jgi:GTP-binding protein
MKIHWSSTDFKIGANTLEQIPDTYHPEIAFAGRSNVGKSSLINAICERNSLTRVSRNPGCTQQLNFFLISEKIYMVDMPGYGYAKKSKEVKYNWEMLIRDYLAGRPNLKRVFLLVDSRRGVNDLDQEIMELLDDKAVPYQICFTKVDEIKESDKKKLIEQVEKIQKKHLALHPEILFTSSEKKIGIQEVRKEILSFL